MKNTYILSGFVKNSAINYYEKIKNENNVIEVKVFLDFGNVFSSSDKATPRITAGSKPRRDIVSAILFAVFSSNKYIDDGIVKYRKFNGIDQAALGNKTPSSKKKYLNMTWIEPNNGDVFDKECPEAKPKPLKTIS